MDNIKQSVQELADHLMENIHGSGIDSDWREVKKNNHIAIRNSYHCMDQYGYYDGWQDFSVLIPLNGSVSDFKVVFHSPAYLAQKYSLRDYLDDLFSQAIHTWLVKYPKSYRIITKVEHKGKIIDNDYVKYCLDPGLTIASGWKNRPTKNEYRIVSFEIKYPKS